MLVVVLLVEVAGVELRLRLFDQLFFCGAVPNATCVRFSVQRLEQLPHDGYAAVIEEALVRWRANVDFSVIALEGSLKVSGVHVKLSHS
eukprot:6177408-Pleurochrysis_carterae.AAC.1